MTVTVPALTRRLVAEFIGTGQLLSAVVGSGVMASRLSPHHIGSSDWRTPSPPRWRRRPDSDPRSGVPRPLKPRGLGRRLTLHARRSSRTVRQVTGSRQMPSDIDRSRTGPPPPSTFPPASSLGGQHPAAAGAAVVDPTTTTAVRGLHTAVCSRISTRMPRPESSPPTSPPALSRPAAPPWWCTAPGLVVPLEGDRGGVHPARPHRRGKHGRLAGSYGVPTSTIPGTRRRQWLHRSLPGALTVHIGPRARCPSRLATASADEPATCDRHTRWVDGSRRPPRGSSVRRRRRRAPSARRSRHRSRHRWAPRS
jgi:hypothetical protein